jgi:cyanophycin synthetase
MAVRGRRSSTARRDVIESFGFLGPTSREKSCRPTTRALVRLGSTGRTGREVACRLDLLRSIRPTTLARHARLLAPGPFFDNAERLYRSIWGEAARACGADLTDMGRGFFELRRGTRRTLVWRHLVELDNPATLQFALDKAAARRALEDAGIAVPGGGAFKWENWEEAAELLDRYAACVVKPAANTGGGLGVTGGVRRFDDLARAVLGAGRSEDGFLVEEHAEGDEYRLLFFDGELLDVIRRRPPAVRGDGVSSVASLVDGENRRRIHAGGERGSVPIRLNLDSVLAVRAQGFDLESIVPTGVQVRVKSAANEAGSPDCSTVRDCPQELVDLGRRAAQASRLRFAGVEMIVPASGGPAQPVVLEVNGTPGLHYHYQVEPTEDRRCVAVAVLERLLRTTDVTQEDR